MATSVKRSLDDSVESNPAKKRKLDEESSKSADSPSTVASTETPTADVAKANEADPSDQSNFVFKASAFTFTKNDWTKSSDDTKDKKDSDKMSTFGNSFGSFKKKKGKKDTEKQKDSADSKETKEGAKDKEDKWGGVWSNQNADGTFKMSFDWGNWTDSNSKIDLNPTTPIGFGSEAPKFDPDKIESNEDTQKVVESMSGEQDTGDKDDEVLCSVHCKVYNLEKGKYVERGRGKVNVNKLKTEGEDGKVRGRILCRRDTIMTMLINAPILKDMKFEKSGKFVRFGVVEKVEKKESEKTDSKDEEEDIDLSTEIKTYLIRPTKDAAHTDVLLSKIKEIQEMLS